MRRSVRRSISAVAVALMGTSTLACGTDDGATADSVVQPSGSPSVENATAHGDPVDDAIFVLPEADDLALLDSQASPSQSSNGGSIFAAFALAGSPDDDDGGVRVSFAIGDSTNVPTDDVTSAGTEIIVDDRRFHWVDQGENQRIYVGSSSEGTMLSMATSNVDDATAMLVLAVAEISGTGDVTFDGRVVPDGWVDTGTSTTLLQFLAGASGSSTPIDGSRDLYADPNRGSTPSWDDINGGFGVTLSTWPVSGTDPHSEAQYNLDGEVEIEIQRSDGSSTTGFASPPDSEFIEYVVWRDETSWLALSRPVDGGGDALADLAATVRRADATEVERLALLRAE